MATSPLFSNNAPPPIPGGWGNPTGAITGKSPSPGVMPFPLTETSYTTPTYNQGAFSSSNLAGLSSGFNTGPYDTELSNLLGKTYGQGAGSILNNIFTQGLFNPSVAAAFLNAMQPGISRGEGDILNAFGAEGSRFGSAASLGLGDYLSQVNLNEQSTLASLFENAQGQELGLLGSILPDLHKERANHGGLLSDILGGLEAVGGALLAPFTGGTSLGLTATGISTITGGNSGGSGTSQGLNASQLQALLGNFGIGGGTSAITGSDQPSLPPADLSSIIQQLQLEGNPLSPQDKNSNDNNPLLQLLQSGMLIQ